MPPNSLFIMPNISSAACLASRPKTTWAPVSGSSKPIAISFISRAGFVATVIITVCTAVVVTVLLTVTVAGAPGANVVMTVTVVGTLRVVVTVEGVTAAEAIP